MTFQRKIFFSFVFLVFKRLVFVSGQHSLETDKTSLLEFKKSIKLDPKSALSNWNETTEVCRFNGISCKNGNRVSRMELIGAGLVGQFPSVISNLTALRSIDLSNNGFYGNIPRGISSLVHLRNLLLDVNNLHGSIPESLASLTNLRLLDLGSNKFHGEIPPSLFSNCSLLSNLDLSYNLLVGKIPVEIGNCPNLWNLNLYNNQFIGEIPFSLSNASDMYNLDVEYNYLSGELPSNLVSKLAKLLNLHLSYNRMVSHDQNDNLDVFFTALSNCSTLKELELAGMGLGGTLPDSVGKLGVNISYILLQENNIRGSVPPVIANLSQLIYLNLTSNILDGTISPEISRLSRLDTLWLSYNLFTGEIPEEIGNFPHLGELELSHNRLEGKIPEMLGNLATLNSLSLGHNLLSGNIPSSLGKCVRLSSLDLSYNRLTGKLPSGFLSAMSQNAIILNLSHNRLRGHLPRELSNLVTAKEIDLSVNNFTGAIFPKISSYMALEMLNLSSNSFRGSLPDYLTRLTTLETLDLSNNSLTGNIPTDLNKLETLRFLNLSFNSFEGKVPSGGIFNSATSLSFLGNPDLCGHISGLRACSRKKKLFRSPVFLIVFYVTLVASVLITTVFCVFGFRYLKRIITSNSISKTESLDLSIKHKFPRITYHELSNATNGFDSSRLLGSGGYGRVYKGVLSDQTEIAVKVLQLQTSNSTKSFNRECEVLKRIRHRNLIRIITACSLPDFKAIVLPFMANGSLDHRLYPDGGVDLNLIERVSICSDIAEGMAYLHHHSPVKVIHCDLKPSNVLLNDDMTALVSDFGIAKLVMTIAGNGNGNENMGNSTANLLCGSIGYIAPEYGYGSSISTKGDVYSFGILVLEMVTRKRPTDDMFSEGLGLHTWVKNHYHRHMERVVDSSLIQTARDQLVDVRKMWEVAIGELLEMGILCTHDLPSNRPTMLDAADDLGRLKRYLSGDTTATFASSLGISSSTISEP